MWFTPLFIFFLYIFSFCCLCIRTPLFFLHFVDEFLPLLFVLYTYTYVCIIFIIIIIIYIYKKATEWQTTSVKTIKNLWNEKYLFLSFFFSYIVWMSLNKNAYFFLFLFLFMKGKVSAFSIYFYLNMHLYINKKNI